MKRKTSIFILAAILAFCPAAYSSASGVVSSPVQQSPEEVEKYWTPERMRDAKPMPMPSPPLRAEPEPVPEPQPAPEPSIPPGRACTMEAKACPDGSYVSRTGPNCEFAPCPGDSAGGSAGSAESGNAGKP